MKIIAREGYSKSFEFESPEYFEEHEDFTQIDESIYQADIRGESALIIYNENQGASDTIDIVGEFNAVRGAQWNHRQKFGADKGFNNGVRDHYEPDRPIESKQARKALREFGVDTQGLEPEEKEKVTVSSD